MTAAVDALTMWRKNPAQFVRDNFNVEPDDWQLDALNAVAQCDWRQVRLAMKASKGVGKSALLAWVIWWFMATRTHPKVVCTSITEDNLNDGLWTELARWRAESPLLQAMFEWTKSRIFAVDHPETWWCSARTWPKGGDATQQANTLAGIHADNVLFVLDESGGIPDAVMAAAEAGLANADPAQGREALLVQAGNPTHLSGPLYRACTSEAALWDVIEISSAPDNPKRSPRVSIQWAQEQIDKYGRDNPWVLVNVFGQFPPSSENSLLGPEDVSAAMSRLIPPAAWKHEPKVLGVDVARQGDDRTVMFLRQGPVAFQPRVLRIPDLHAVAMQVAQVIEQQRPDAVFIDIAMGAAVADILRALGHANIVLVGFGDADYETKFKNVRAGMWWRMAQWVRKVGAIPAMPELRAELVAPTYKFDPASKLQLEAKVELKKRLGYSPDIADALALTFAAPVASREVREEMKARSATGRQSDFDPYGG